jgi:hypothetical protein
MSARRAAAPFQLTGALPISVRFERNRMEAIWRP